MCIYIYIYLDLYTCKYIYIHMHTLCIYTERFHIHMYVCMHIYIYIFGLRLTYSLMWYFVSCIHAERQMFYVCCLPAGASPQAMITPAKRKQSSAHRDEPSPIFSSDCKRLRVKSPVVIGFNDRVKEKLLRAIEAHGLGNQANAERCNFFTSGPVKVCQICEVARHTVKWITRVTGKQTIRTTGSQCYACSRATLLLGCTRNLKVLLEVPEALRTVRMKSFQLRAVLQQQNADFCTCVDCNAACQSSED